jgi:F0F1-type ATP synthase beta subunit
VRRLAIVCLKNGPPARETIALLAGLAEADEEERELREAAQKIAAFLTKKSHVEANARRSGGR